MKLRVRRIEKAQDFVALAPIWAQLAEESGQLSPFLSYDWFWCCWHGVWPQRRPEILLIEETGGPVAIVPLMHWTERFYGLPVRTMGFLQCPHTPMMDVLTIADHKKVLATFLDHLVARSDWDTVWLSKIPMSSPAVKTLEELLPGRLPWRRAGALRLPYLAIEGEWGSFVKSAGFKKLHTPLEDQLELAAAINLEEHRAVDLQSPVLQEVLELTRHDRKIDGGIALTKMPRALEFFRELTRRATRNGWLSLWLLRLKDRVIAMEYQLQSDGQVQALHSYQDEAHHALHPRITLRLAILQSLFESGCVHEYRMAPATDSSGFQWANGSHEMAHLKLYRPGLYPRLLCSLEPLVSLGA
jgi:CelD/BcsL family acetyltransferase involved in cellulose biosynthesis